MPDVFVTPQDRVNLATMELARGSPSGAARAMFSPDTMSPNERRTVAERFGITDPGPLKSLMEATANPTVILGAILSWKYAAPGTRDYLSQNAMWEKEGIKKFMPGIDHMASFQDIYKGTPLPRLLFRLGERTHSFQKAGAEKIGKATVGYLQEIGQPVDAATEVKLGLYRVQKSGYLGESLRKYADDVEKVRPDLAEKLRTATKQLPEITLSPAEQRLNNALTDYFNWAYQKTGPDRVGGMRGTIDRAASRFWRDSPSMRGTRWRPPAIGEEIPDHYLPLLPAGSEDPTLQMHKQRVFSQSVLEEGEQLRGTKIMGAKSVTLSPSETERLLDRYMTEVAFPQGITGADELAAGFRKYVSEFSKGLQEAATAKVASGTHLARMERMVPAIQGLERMGEGPWKALAEVEQEISKAHVAAIMRGQQEAWRGINRRYFRVDALGTTLNYNLLRARDFGYSVTPPGSEVTIGQQISRATKEIGTGQRVLADGTIQTAINGADPVRYAILKDTYIPAILGQSTYPEIMAASMWDNMRWNAAKILAPDATVGGLLEKAGAGKLRESLMRSIADSPKLAYKPAMQGISDFFYQTTLGAPNIIAPIKNLFQTLITTVPEFGLKSTMRGLQHATESFQNYIKYRWTNGLDHMDAFDKAFPMFANTEFSMSDALLESLDKTHAVLEKSVGELSTRWRKFQQLSMSLFSTSELWNRTVAHGAATHNFWGTVQEMARKGIPLIDEVTGKDYPLPKSLASLRADPKVNQIIELVAKDAALEQSFATTAAMGVARTQFGGGLLNAPKFLAEYPAPLRQLSQFPVRYLNLLMRSGGGFFGRALLGTGLALGLGKLLFGESGEKIASEATMFGAVPVPNSDSPFSPLPFVPPILQLAGSVATSALTGDATQIKRSLPLLMPGGVGMSRVLPVTPGVSDIFGPAFNRSYVDYSQVGPDGRYPLRTPDGSLVGYYSPAQLLGRAMGLGDIQGTQELALTNWMIGYGKRTTEQRREYAEALANNDQRMADSIEADYLAQNPGLTELPLKKSQIRSMHLRRDVSRVERVMDVVPEDVRGQFIQAASVAFANAGPSFLGLQPGGLESGATVGARDPYRIRPMTTIPVMSENFGQAASQMQQFGEWAANDLLGT